MEALKAELERKRKERESAAGAPTVGGDGKRKWVRKGDIERARVAKYHEDEAIDEAERKKRLVVPCLKRYDEAQPADADAGAALARASAGGSSGVGKSADAAAPAEKTPQSAAEVKRLLRKLGQPIQLFCSCRHLARGGSYTLLKQSFGCVLWVIRLFGVGQQAVCE